MLKNWKYVLGQQKSEDDCGARSLYYALKAIGFPFAPISRWRSWLHSQELPLHRFGLLSPQIALLARKCGCATELICASDTANVIVQAVGNLCAIQEREVVASDRVIATYVTSLQKFLSMSGSVRSVKATPTIKWVHRHLLLGGTAIVEIRSTEFYGISDKFGHFVAILPGKEGITVVDPYAMRGFTHYGKQVWSRALMLARRYPWAIWHGDAILLKAN